MAACCNATLQRCCSATKPAQQNRVVVAQHNRIVVATQHERIVATQQNRYVAQNRERESETVFGASLFLTKSMVLCACVCMRSHNLCGLKLPVFAETCVSIMFVCVPSETCVSIMFVCVFLLPNLPQIGMPSRYESTKDCSKPVSCFRDHLLVSRSV